MSWKDEIQNLLSNMKIPNITEFSDFNKFLVAILFAYLCFVITRSILRSLARSSLLKTKEDVNKILYKYRVFSRISHLVPITIIYFFLLMTENFNQAASRFITVYFYWILAMVIISLLNSFADIYKISDPKTTKPITSYTQMTKIMIIIVCCVLSVSTVLDKSPTFILSGIGAMTAILLLIFKDTILSIVASIQIASNDLLRIGDWISMPKFNADGHVAEILLHTVKVQNWDKTITSIPSHKFLEESFQNWRGMVDSGGRRIARSINIDMSTIKFLDKQLIDKLKKVRLLKEYIEERQQKLEEQNRKSNIDLSISINGFRMTNIGIFRTYLYKYLENNENINKAYTMVVRQLTPSENGLPIQVYAFSKDTRLAYYEKIQSDIFDHILAVIPEFDLRVFQNPTGSDFARYAHNRDCSGINSSTTTD